MMPSHEQTLRRRSSRLAEKRWSAHFQKCNRTVPTYVDPMLRNAHGAVARGYCPNQKIPGVYDKITSTYYHISSIFEIFMEYPGTFIHLTSTIQKSYISTAIEFLYHDEVRCPKTSVAKELNSVLLDFLQMCDYLHLYV
jgi:hypothetical protein